MATPMPTRLSSSDATPSAMSPIKLRPPATAHSAYGSVILVNLGHFVAEHVARHAADDGGGSAQKNAHTR